MKAFLSCCVIPVTQFQIFLTSELNVWHVAEQLRGNSSSFSPSDLFHGRHVPEEPQTQHQEESSSSSALRLCGRGAETGR